MPATLPVDFQEMAQRPRGQTASDYPYAIKATDLMKNFVYAALDADQTLIEEPVGQGGHKSRRLKIPAVPSGSTPQSLTATNGSLAWTDGIPTPPTTGTHVLGVVNGVLQWLATEECA
jgi:hypothetical protein